MQRVNRGQWTLIAATRDGHFIARYSSRGLCALNFPVNEGQPGRVPSGSSEAPPQVLRWHQTTAAAIESILQGKPPRSLPPLDLSGGTQFQQSVWKLLCDIGPGVTRSYGEIAELLRRPKAARAVGQACGANPIPLLVPCHRVLAANRRIGGFSGGLSWKERLLSREGIVFQSTR